MKSKITAELRRIAKDLSLVADDKTEKRLQEIKRDFIESLKKSPSIQNLNPEQLWKRIQNEIRGEIRKHPSEWRSV